jgi:hypothetical protein
LERDKLRRTIKKEKNNLKKNDLVEMPENYNYISKEKNSELSIEQDFEVGKSCVAGKYYNHKITKFRFG